MESLSQAKVGSALQVFFNLEELQQVCKGVEVWEWRGLPHRLGVFIKLEGLQQV